MKSATRQQQPQKPFENLAEALAGFTAPADLRCALVDDVHLQGRRFSRLTPKELLQACGVEIGNLGEFCISQELMGKFAEATETINLLMGFE